MSSGELVLPRAKAGQEPVPMTLVHLSDWMSASRTGIASHPCSAEHLRAREKQILSVVSGGGELFLLRHARSANLRASLPSRSRQPELMSQSSFGQ
jgi:hypothetical protein